LEGSKSRGVASVYRCVVASGVRLRRCADGGCDERGRLSYALCSSMQAHLL